MFYSTVSICFSTTTTHLFAPRPLFDSVATCVFFKTLFINIPRGAILKPSTPTSSNEWNSLFLSSFFSCFEIVNFPDLSWIWILPPFRIKNASKSKNLYSKIRTPRFYSQIKLFDLTATKPHTNTHTHVYTKIQRKSKFNESNETRRNRKANWNSVTKINCKKKKDIFPKNRNSGVLGILSVKPWQFRSLAICVEQRVTGRSNSLGRGACKVSVSEKVERMLIQRRIIWNYNRRYVAAFSLEV